MVVSFTVAITRLLARIGVNSPLGRYHRGGLGKLEGQPRAARLTPPDQHTPLGTLIETGVVDTVPAHMSDAPSPAVVINVESSCRAGRNGPNRSRSRSTSPALGDPRVAKLAATCAGDGVSAAERSRI